jgi:chromosome partition protein MukE
MNATEASMSVEGYERLDQAIEDPLFPEVDLALRAGRHIDVEEGGRYELLAEAQPLLEGFYQRYGWELVRAPAGYFFLVPHGERLSRRQLTTGEMLVGQALALLYLDPATLETAGAATRSQVVEILQHLVGEARLYLELHPRRRKVDERIAAESVRREVDKALRSLAHLGFVDLVDEERLKLRTPLIRFAEPVLAMDDPASALARLVSKGRAALGTDKDEGTQEEGGDEVDA